MSVQIWFFLDYWKVFAKKVYQIVQLLEVSRKGAEGEAQIHSHGTF